MPGSNNNKNSNNNTDLKNNPNNNSNSFSIPTGKYGSPGVNYWIERIVFDGASIYKNLEYADIPKNLGTPIEDAYAGVMAVQTQFFKGTSPKGKYINPNLPGLNATGGEEAYPPLYSIFSDAKKSYEDIIAGLDEKGKKFENLFKVHLSLLETGKGDLAEAMSDNPFLPHLYSALSGGPLIPVKKVVDEGGKTKNVPDFDKMEENLGEVTQPLMDMYGSFVNLLDLEYEKQKLVSKGITPEEEKEYLQKLKKEIDVVTDNFDKLREIEIKNPHKYDKNVLNNSLDHLVGVSPDANRDLAGYIASMKAMSKAIDNGWGLNELPLFAYVGIVSSANKKSLKNIPPDIETREKNKQSMERDLEENEKRIEVLKKNPDANKDELKNLENRVNATKKSLLPDAEKTIKRLKKSINDNNKLADKLSEIETLANKKPSSAAEKLHILDTISGFASANEMKDLCVRGYDATYDEYTRNYQSFFDDYKKNRQKFVDSAQAEFEQKKARAHSELPLLDELGKSDVKLMNIIDIYGSQPNHHPEWGKMEDNRVIGSKEFNESFRPYDKKDLPFNEAEIASLGIFASFGATEELRKVKNNPFLTDDKDLLNNNWTLWTLDCGYDSSGPRANFGTYRNIVAYGREQAKIAMEEYTKGNKEPLASIIHTGLNQISHSYDVDATLGNNTPLYYSFLSSFDDIMKRDPELREKVNSINEKCSEKEKVDFDKVSQVKEVYKYYVEGTKAKDEMESLPADKKPEAAKKALYGAVFGEVFDRGVKYLDAGPVRVDLENAFNQEMMDSVKKNIVLSEDEIAAKNYARLQKDIVPQKSMFYMATPEGKTDFEEFVDVLSVKYGISTPNEFVDVFNNPKSAEKAEKINSELTAYSLYAANKNIINELEKGDKTPEEMKRLAGEYIHNAFFEKGCRKNIETGQRDDFFYFNLSESVNKAMPDRKKFEEQFKSFMNSFDMKGMNSKNLASLLKDKNFNDNIMRKVDGLMVSRNYESYKTWRSANKFNNFDNAVTGLENGQKGVWFGTKEYDDLLKDLKNLNDDIKKADEEYAKSGVYVNADLSKREKELMERMKKYNARKDAEIKNDTKNGKKPNENSVKRRDAMKAALDALTQRNKLDMVSADYTKESIENSAEALTGLEQSKKQMENQARMAEEQKPAASQAGAGQNNKVQADNKQAEIKSPADKKKKEDDLFENIGPSPKDHIKVLDTILTEETNFRKSETKTWKIIASVHRSMFIDTIKNEYMDSISKNDMEKSKRLVDNVFNRTNFKKNLDNFSKNYSGTLFEKELVNITTEKLRDKNYNLTHENVIDIKNKALVTAYNKARVQYSSNSSSPEQKLNGLGEMIKTAKLAKTLDGEAVLKVSGLDRLENKYKEMQTKLNSAAKKTK